MLKITTLDWQMKITTTDSENKMLLRAGSFYTGVAYGTVYTFSVLIASASSEGAGKSAHMHRLSRDFAARTHELWMMTKSQTKL